MRKRKDYIEALMKYHREYYTDGGFPSIFSLQQKMLTIGICPRCGIKSKRWSSIKGHFPCLKCGFQITENEINKVLDDPYGKQGKRSILLRRLKDRKGNNSRIK